MSGNADWEMDADYARYAHGPGNYRSNLSPQNEVAGITTPPGRGTASCAVITPPEGPSLRIGVDLDGVVYDFIDSLRQFIVLMGLDGYWKPAPAMTWEFYKDWGMSREEFLHACNDAVEIGWMFWQGDTLDNAEGELQRLADAGHTLHILTDRSFGWTPGISKMATCDWLENQAIPYHSITFTADKTCVPTDYMIDDKLENYDALDAAGCQVYLRNRPWNQVEGDNRRRVDSLSEFVDIVLSAHE